MLDIIKKILNNEKIEIIDNTGMEQDECLLCFMYKGYKRGPSKTGRVDAGIWYTAAIASSVVLDITYIFWILIIVIVKIIHYPVTGLIKWLSEADIDIEKH